MSNLEDKLSASMQAPRRRTGGPAKTADQGRSPQTPAPTGSAQPVRDADLNHGGGRATNPARIWPD